MKKARMSQQAAGSAGGRRSKTFQVERLGIEPVAPADRYGSPWTLATLWFGANVQFASLVTGALSTAVLGLSFWQALAAMSLGIVTGSALLAALSTAVLAPALHSSSNHAAPSGTSATTWSPHSLKSIIHNVES
ncbi:cytosine permease [Saccharopolyspora shandongensis]|uniref:cytosine permease n=1 Tax=Saccharopolyspora shandongensis TaxID=418495 RepID=UPI0033DA4DFD